MENSIKFKQYSILENKNLVNNLKGIYKREFIFLHIVKKIQTPF